MIFIGIGGPHEGFGMIVGFLQEAVDGGLEIDNRAEGTAFEAAFGQFGEEALDRIEPRGRGRGVMEDKARMPVEPGANFGVLVCRVVVEDDVDDLAGRDVGFDRIEESGRAHCLCRYGSPPAPPVCGRTWAASPRRVRN